MARQETERENLLRDASALVERIEWRCPASAGEPAEHVVAGFRRDGCASFYFGTEPAYHFNAAGDLRRAYVDDELIKAQHGQLVAMRRVRTAGQVQLVSRALTDDATTRFLDAMRNRCAALRQALATGQLEQVGQVPPAADVAVRVARWLDKLEQAGIARSPHAR